MVGICVTGRHHGGYMCERTTSWWIDTDGVWQGYTKVGYKHDKAI